MPGDRVGSRRVNGETRGAFGSQGQGEEHVAPAVLVVVHPYAGKAGGLASGDEVSGLADWQTHWNPDIHFHCKSLMAPFT